MQYSEKTLKFYEAMKNVGGFDQNLMNVGTGIVGSPLCGDVMKLQLFFDETNVIFDAKYKVFGCVSAIASMELATTILKGKTIKEALQIKNEEIADSLELSDIKRHCSVLAKEAIEAAINDYLSKLNKENNMITITENALKKLKELLTEQKAIGISISIISGGCSGIDYSMSYELQKNPQKTEIMISGILFFYEKEAEMLMNGLNIDLVENSFGHGFVITNKNHITCSNCSCNCKK
jgi:nitrogen fixation NifU-like protein